MKANKIIIGSLLLVSSATLMSCTLKNSIEEQPLNDVDIPMDVYPEYGIIEEPIFEIEEQNLLYGTPPYIEEENNDEKIETNTPELTPEISNAIESQIITGVYGTTPIEDGKNLELVEEINNAIESQIITGVYGTTPIENE